MESTEIVKRIRALTNKLLPVEVEVSDISSATSSIITPGVIEAYGKCGGDFGEAVPFWLVRQVTLPFLSGLLTPLRGDYMNYVAEADEPLQSAPGQSNFHERWLCESCGLGRSPLQSYSMRSPGAAYRAQPRSGSSGKRNEHSIQIS
jgi:hypothetical protein